VLGSDSCRVRLRRKPAEAAASVRPGEDQPCLNKQHRREVEPTDYDGPRCEWHLLARQQATEGHTTRFQLAPGAIGSPETHAEHAQEPIIASDSRETRSRRRFDLERNRSRGGPAAARTQAVVFSPSRERSRPCAELWGNDDDLHDHDRTPAFAAQHHDDGRRRLRNRRDHVE
jgi:hypothetical protein